MRIIYIVLISLFPLFIQGQSFKSFNQTSENVNVTLADGILSIIPLTDNAIRIKYFLYTEESLPELILSSETLVPKFQVSEVSSKLEVKGKNISVLVDKRSGKLAFADSAGKIFLSELADTRKLLQDSVMGEKCYQAEQSFNSPDGEYIFGLGQFQDGHFNLKGVSRRLTQVNSQISIPFIYSSEGYGLLWHQYGLTDFNPADNFIGLKKQEQQTGNDNLVEVTTTSGIHKVPQNQSLYSGKFTVTEDGEYSIFLDLGDMGNRHFVVIDGKPCLDQSNIWLPPTAGALLNLKAGEHEVQIICKSDNTPTLSWKQIDNTTTFRSPHSKMIDYVVFYGPSADGVIASYRKLSGNAPLLPEWAYGFWQCRERYTSGTHLVETVEEFRKRKLPMDVIVQDWQYWGDNGWGVPQFDETNYSNPAGFIKEIHDLNAHLSISIWSNPDKNSEIGQKYMTKNLYIPNSKWLDYYNPETRKEYWNTLKENLFDYGVDSWWMDATEPENDDLTGKQTYIGPGDFYRLTYPLFVSKAVYEGQRNANPDKRVCILTRSAFAGQQRFGTINWSGDIGGTWDAYRHQIVSGLNYALTGMPYWTTDIGGFFRPGSSQYTDEKYHDLLTRWFQWGAFNPIFRIHGYQSETEPWKYGQKLEGNIRSILDLRYRLLPYIYSEAWQVSKNGSTMMRPLVMDFNNDTKAISQPFEYMFGKAFLVAPITEPNVAEREVYLPDMATWYNFWTGERLEGGQLINTAAPLDKIPLFVKAGSIIPMGKFIQYTGQKSADTLEIRIYQGADCSFDLYEDEGDNYNYENGNYALIRFNWVDQNKTLTIEERNGTFPGILKDRIFNILLVSDNRGTGVDISSSKDQMINYSGTEKVIVLK